MTKAMTRLGLVLAMIFGLAVPAYAQDIIVTQGKVEIFDNGMFDFGELRPGGITSKTFTVENNSPFRIDLGGSVTGAGWVGALNKTTLRSGQRARLVVTVDRSTSGQKSALVSITDSNLGGEIFAFSVKATVLTNSPQIRLTQGRSVVGDEGFVSFGRIDEDESSTRVFNLRNIGTATLNLSNFAVSGQGFELVRAPSGSLAPGKTTRFSVRMNGGNPGARAGSIGFGTNIPADSQFLVELGGTIGDGLPAAQISQAGVLLENGDAFAFDETVTGATQPKRFRVRNNGDGPLALMSLTTSDPQFTVDGLTTTSVDEGQAADFFVTYRPTAEGVNTGTLTIVTNDPATPSLSVAMSGLAGPPPEIVVALAVGVNDYELQDGSSVLIETDSMVPDEIEFDFTITNDGEGPLQIFNVQVLEDAPGLEPRFFLISGGQPTVLEQGQTTGFKAGFGPPMGLAERFYSGTAIILNSDPDSPSFDTGLIVNVQMPASGPTRPSAAALHVAADDQGPLQSGDAYDFGASVGDHAVVRSFTVVNSTGAPLRSGKLSIAGAGFSVLTQPARDLAPGARTTFEIAFDAARVGQFAAAVTLAYDGDNAGEPFVFAVTGESAR